jgi:transcriptional regulator with XRE-family HTH domain
MLGVSQKTVNHYERRTANPSLDLIQRLASFLEVPPAELLTTTPTPTELVVPRRTKPGPKSQLEHVVERLLELPRAEQMRVVELIEDAVARAEQRVSG